MTTLKDIIENENEIEKDENEDRLKLLNKVNEDKDDTLINELTNKFKDISFIDRFKFEGLKSALPSKFIKYKLNECFKITKIINEINYKSTHCFDDEIEEYQLIFDSDEKIYALEKDYNRLLVLKKLKNFDDNINLPLISYQLNRLAYTMHKIENDFDKIDIYLYC